MKGPEEGAAALQRERERIADLEEGLWRYVYLFDPKSTRECCHEYIRPNSSPNETSLFKGREYLFTKENRLFLGIDVCRQFPDMMRSDLDKCWGEVEFRRLDTEYIGLQDLYRLVFQKLQELLVYEAKANGLNDFAISMFCEVTWTLIGTLSQRKKLWEDRFCIAKWPDCGLETGRLPLKYHRDLLAGAAVIKQLSVQVKRWQEKLIVCFRTDAEYNGKSMIPGTIDEIGGTVARRGLECGWLEPATQSDLERYRVLMRNVDKNEKTTAANELSRSICREEFERKVKAREERKKNRGREYVVEEEILPPDAPSLIVRFLRLGSAGDRSFSVGEVYPIEKERALTLLLHDSPIVELASPEELKRDRELVDRLESIRKEWDRKRIPTTDRLVQVRFLRQGKNPANGHSCDPGETWDVGFDTAYLLSRGREPMVELLNETTQNGQPGLKPHWDQETHKLTLNGTVIRDVRPIAKWKDILNVFQELGWPTRIDNPLTGPQASLNDCIRQLNKGLTQIEFYRDGTGEGICWRPKE